MIKTHIQDKLLLFLDGDLPEKEMEQIREHLSSCSGCAERRDVLAAVWQTEKRMERTKPSPFLWTRLQARIKEYEQALVFVWNLKSAMQGITMQPLSILAIVGAIIVGIYLGTPRKSQGYIGGRSNIQLAGVGDELGLDKFDLIPPGTLGKTVVNMYNTQK